MFDSELFDMKAVSTLPLSVAQIPGQRLQQLHVILDETECGVAAVAQDAPNALAAGSLPWATSVIVVDTEARYRLRRTVTDSTTTPLSIDSCVILFDTEPVIPEPAPETLARLTRAAVAAFGGTEFLAHLERTASATPLLPSLCQSWRYGVGPHRSTLHFSPVDQQFMCFCSCARTAITPRPRTSTDKAKLGYWFNDEAPGAFFREWVEGHTSNIVSTSMEEAQ